MSPKMVTGKANGKRNEKTVSDRPVTLPTREQLIAQLNEDLYGRKISARQILVEKTVATPPAAGAFMAALRRSAADIRN